MPMPAKTCASMYCITSSAIIEGSKIEEISVETQKAEGEKCPVCWKVSKAVCKRHSDLK